MSNNTQQSYLYHHGIKGMKWGVRRFQNSDGTLTPEGKKRYGDGGETSTSDGRKRHHVGRGLTIEERKKGRLATFLGNKFKSIRREQERMIFYDIKKGKDVVGNLSLFKKSSKTLDMDLEINAKHRGKKYATAVMDWVVQSSKDKGYENLTLFDPNYDAVNKYYRKHYGMGDLYDTAASKHMYEKYGFEAQKEIADPYSFGEGGFYRKKKLR